jgi:hypothetical protein
VTRWKTGFYHIACGAGVPLVLAFLDYARKEGGLGPVIQPTGNLEADMAKILGFYATITGKHPEKTGTVVMPSGRKEVPGGRRRDQQEVSECERSA